MVGVEKLSGGAVGGRFFHFWPPRKVKLLQWLAYWMKRGKSVASFCCCVVLMENSYAEMLAVMEHFYTEMLAFYGTFSC